MQIGDFSYFDPVRKIFTELIAISLVVIICPKTFCNNESSLILSRRITSLYQQLRPYILEASLFISEIG
jgi:hypothetical protein